MSNSEDKVIKNITNSLWITTITGGLSIIVFIWAYSFVKQIWLLIVPILFVGAIITFHIMANKIKKKYLQAKEKSEKSEKKEKKEN